MCKCRHSATKQTFLWTGLTENYLKLFAFLRWRGVTYLQKIVRGETQCMGPGYVTVTYRLLFPFFFDVSCRSCHPPPWSIQSRPPPVGKAKVLTLRDSLMKCLQENIFTHFAWCSGCHSFMRYYFRSPEVFASSFNSELHDIIGTVSSSFVIETKTKSGSW